MFRSVRGKEIDHSRRVRGDLAKYRKSLDLARVLADQAADLSLEHDLVGINAVLSGKNDFIPSHKRMSGESIFWV